MSDHMFQNQYRMLYLSPWGTGHVDSQSLQNSQWDFKCLSTRYSKYLVKKKQQKKKKKRKKTILKRGISDVRNNSAFRSI